MNATNPIATDATRTLEHNGSQDKQVLSGAEVLLETAWEMQTQEDKANMCWGWGYDQEFMLESFFSEMDNGLVTRPQAIEFFDEKCS